MTGQIGTSKRGKLSVIAEATSEVTESVEPDKLAPYSDHFHPPIGLRKGNKSPGQPMHVATAVPYAEQVRFLPPHTVYTVKVFYVDHTEGYDRPMGLCSPTAVCVEEHAAEGRDGVNVYII